ncbi:hypothetical protein ACU4GD_28420 [Cupriavidus basilensis]
MALAFVDVRPGDTLTGGVRARQRRALLAGEQLTADIDDPDFRPSLLLDLARSATRAPATCASVPLGLARVNAAGAASAATVPAFGGLRPAYEDRAPTPRRRCRVRYTGAGSLLRQRGWDRLARHRSAVLFVARLEDDTVPDPLPGRSRWIEPAYANARQAGAGLMAGVPDAGRHLCRTVAAADAGRRAGGPGWPLPLYWSTARTAWSVSPTWPGARPSRDPAALTARLPGAKERAWRA